MDLDQRFISIEYNIEYTEFGVVIGFCHPLGNMDE